MKKKFITTPTSEAITGGGYTGHLSDVQVMDTDEVIEEAIGRGYVTESAHVTEKVMTGVLSSMIDGCGRDGNARRIDGYIQLMPYMTGLLKKKTSGYDPVKNRIVVRARLLKEMEVDTRNWSLSNSTEGHELEIYDVAALGSTDLGKVKVGVEAVANGRYCMQGREDEGVWCGVLDDKGKAIETDLGRCTVVASDVHSVTFQLPAGCSAHVGRRLRFTVKGYAGVEEGELQEATVDADLLAGSEPEPPAPGPTVTKTYPTDQPERIGKFDIEGGGQTFEGEHLAGASLKAKYTGQSGTAYDDPIDASEFTVEDDRIVIAGGEGSQWAGIAASVNAEYPFEVTITTPDGTEVITLEMN